MPQLQLLKWFAHQRLLASLVVSASLLLIFSASLLFQPTPPGFNTGVLSQHFRNFSTTGVHTNVHGDGIHGDEVQWDDFAYVQYVTNENYLCNSLMVLEALHRSGAKADRIMMYPEDWQMAHDDAPIISTEKKLLAQARDSYGVKLVPIKLQSVEKGESTWTDSFTKLLAFNQTQYKRVMSLDSDATVRTHMDELFLIPSSPVAMPRAYWLDQPFLSSQLILIEPSHTEWQRIRDFIDRSDSGYDMDILNTLYKDSCSVIPHKRYNLLSGEYRSEKHDKYLGSPDEPWNGTRVFEEAKFIHFSDWPVPKPWLEAGDDIMQAHEPKCKKQKTIDNEEEDCSDRNIWRGLYKDFTDRRQRICGRSYDGDGASKLRRRHRSNKFEQDRPPKYEMVVPS